MRFFLPGPAAPRRRPAPDRPTYRPAFLGLDPTLYGTVLLDLDAARIVGLADGSPVDTWPSGPYSSRSASQTGTLRPLYRANGGPTSGPAVEFDGVDDFMTLSAGFTAATAHIFLVGTVSDTATDKTVLGGGSAAFNFNFRTDERPLISPYGFTTVTGTVSPSLDAWFQANVSLAGSLAVEHRLSRSANGSGSLGTAPNSATTRVGDVGAFGPRCFKGKIARLLAYDAPLTGPNRDAVEQALFYMYGV